MGVYRGSGLLPSSITAGRDKVGSSIHRLLLQGDEGSRALSITCCVSPLAEDEEFLHLSN